MVDKKINANEMTINVEYHYQFPCCEDHEGSAFTRKIVNVGDVLMCEICGTEYTITGSEGEMPNV